MFLRFSKVRNVKNPVRGHATDAGIDFYMPEIDEQFIKDFTSKSANSGINIANGKDFYIPSKYNATIPSGIKVEIPYGYMGLFLNKSGVASKEDLLIGAQVIDVFYSGEIHIDLHNVGSEPVKISPQKKLAQMVLVPILHCEIQEINEDELYNWMYLDKVRGEGGFGSTDENNPH